MKIANLAESEWRWLEPAPRLGHFKRGFAKLTLLDMFREVAAVYALLLTIFKLVKTRLLSDMADS